MKNNFRRLLASFLISGTLLNCGHKNTHQNKVTFVELEAKTPNKTFQSQISPTSTSKIEGKIATFRARIQKERPLSAATWKLHDELLREYVRLKNKPHVDKTQVNIPAHSRAKLHFRSFCLNSDRASPDKQENYIWKNESPKVPYYREVIQYASENLKVSQEKIQTLLWNLGNKTYFEDYPADLRSILKSIDPKSPIILPSRTKNKATDYLANSIRNYIPVAGEAEDVIAQARSSYADYKDTAEDISKIISKQELDLENKPQEIFPGQLYADTVSNSYHSQDITFYNPSNHNVTFDTSNLYLQPTRTDVQRIGLIPEEKPSDKESLLSKLEKVLFDDMARLGIGFVPIINDVADLYELLSGKDFVSGRDLSLADRAFSGIGLIAGSGAGYRYAERYLNAPERLVGKFKSEFAEIAGKELHASRAEADVFLAEIQSKLESKNLNENSLHAIADLSKEWRTENLLAGDKKKLTSGMDLSTLEKHVVKPGQEVKFYRWYGGDSDKIGRWGMSEKIVDKEVAKNIYALPPENSLTNLAEFRIKEGSKYYTSIAAPLYNGDGGARQIFVLDRNFLDEIP